MRAALRPYATAGVALVGATVIAAAPLAPPPAVKIAAVPTASTDVQLAALVNPFEQFIEIFETAFENATAIGSSVAADPAPILGAIGRNQLITAEFLGEFASAYLSGYLTAVGNIPTTVENALEEIRAGDIRNGFGNLVVGVTVTPFIAPILGLFPYLTALPQVLSNPLQNAANVVETATSLATLFPLVGVLTGVLGPVLQIGDTAQRIYDAIEADDFEAAINAVISFPGDVVNTILNGNPAISTGGILGQDGIIRAFLAVRQAIADAIQPPNVPATSASTFSGDAPTVTVSTEEAGLSAGDTAPPDGGAPAVTGAGTEDDEGDGPVEVKTDAVTNLDEEEVDAAVLEDEAATSETTALRPGQRLLKNFEQAGQRIERHFKEAGKRIDQTIDRLTGRGGDGKKGGNATGTETGNETGSGTTNDGAGGNDGGDDNGSDGGGDADS
jgi:hypothetical protein